MLGSHEFLGNKMEFVEKKKTGDHQKNLGIEIEKGSITIEGS